MLNVFEIQTKMQAVSNSINRISNQSQEDLFIAISKNETYFRYRNVTASTTYVNIHPCYDQRKNYLYEVCIIWIYIYQYEKY